jgi:hypothetical protein
MLMFGAPVLLLFASTPPCPPGAVIEPRRSADDLFAPDPGCEVESADAGVSRRVIYRGTAGTDRWVTVDITRVGGTVGGFIIYDERGELLGLAAALMRRGTLY